MYKVFVDNRPQIYQFESENELLKEFSDHRFIEAAGGIVRNAKGFLFIKRHGLWDIPKGKLEKGEIPEIGAIREIEEECGLQSPDIERHLCNTWHTYKNKGKLVLKKTYWYLLKESRPSELTPQLEEGITEAHFFSESELNIIEKQTYGSIVDVIETLKKNLQN